MSNNNLRIKYYQTKFKIEPEYRREYKLADNSFEIVRFSKIDNKILHDSFVYLTSGISEFAQPGATSDLKFSNIEFSAYSDFLVADKTIPDSDLIANIISEVATFPFRNSTAFEHGQTLDFGRPLIPNSELEGFYLASPPFVKYPDIFDETQSAKTIIHLVPISRKEIEYKLKNGVAKFLDLMGDKNIEPFMDLRRKSSI